MFCRARLPLVRLACPLTSRRSNLPYFAVRGAKTKSTIKFQELPQGLLTPASLPAVKEHLDDQTPAYPRVIQQHLNHVSRFSDCVVLTRIGNFYELYGEQAEQYGPLLNLKVAQRKTALGPVAMAGFQYTQLDRFLKSLVQGLNKHVAISEEVRNSPADQVKNGGLLYNRKVSRIVTAGTLIDETFVDPFENNFLLSIHANLDTTDIVSAPQDAHVGLTWVDLSSGDFFTQRTELASLGSVIARIGAREIILDPSFERVDRTLLDRLLGDGGHAVTYHNTDPNFVSIDHWAPMLEKPVSKEESRSFSAQEVLAGSLLLDYVKGRLLELNVSLRCPIRRNQSDYMSIDKQTLKALEIRSTLRDGLFQGSLLHAIRRTMTKSGARFLSQRLVSPSMSLPEINGRLDLITELLEHDQLREETMSALRRTTDVLRLLQRFSIGKGDADDLLALAKTIQIINQIVNLMNTHLPQHKGDVDSPSSSLSLRALVDRLDLNGPSKLATRILEAIDEEGLSQQHLAEEAEAVGVAELAEQIVEAEGPKAQPTKSGKASVRKAAVVAELNAGEFWIMRRSASTTLKQGHQNLDDIMQEKAQLYEHLRAEIGNTLTLKWTPQLGHFCHVKGKDVRAEIQDARNISSTKNTRTFYLPDWSHLGSRLEDAKIRIRTEEQRVLNDLRKRVIENLVRLRRNANVLDELDVGCSSAVMARERNLVRPVLHPGTTHKIVGGRHPMVDISLQEKGRLFTANDCTVGGEQSILLITGPNMAGKSTYLRQNALITILAQTGCFVPADYAEIGLVDKIFSRVGSADSLYNHQSTFMVEMLEVADILNQATTRSFIIMDEVGRGTTPEDGVAVGYACLHHLHNKTQCRTLFATHFHSLVDMTKDFKHLACYCTDVAEEKDGSWVYVHKLREGVNRSSHALKVAKLAGLPDTAIAVAKSVLDDFERERKSSS
ncbi:muts domain V, partial [Aureobasidium melanogenum]